jgi:hypothetical protein
VQNQKGLIAPATEGQQSEIRNISGSLSADDPKQLILLQNRAFLVAYARELINTQADRSARLIAQSTTT